jgi:hypothetical protein
MKPRPLILPAVFIAVCVGVTAGLVDLGANDAKEIAAESLQVNDTNTPTKKGADFSAYVDSEGNIRLPKDYKQKWSHLGNWAVAKKPGETVHEMHNVYTQPQTITAFNKSGEFPDGAVLVKEVRVTKSDGLTTGHSAWSTNMKLWFVMIKDRKERFKDSDHWGDGWGWALFEAKDPSKNVSAGYDTSCLGCHVPAEDSDWVYTYGYPSPKQSEK